MAKNKISLQVNTKTRNIKSNK